MEFLDPKLDNYIHKYTAPEPELLMTLNRETNANVLKPRMLSGHLQGRVLSMLSHMIRPEIVLEIGTYTGYSALCLAEGLNSRGKVITIDINEELEDIVKKHISNSSYEDQIELMFGNALHIIPTLPNNIDLLFIDADKENYCNYYDLAFDKIKIDGYIIADNVLWSGKVVDENAQDDETKMLRAYNQKVLEDPRVENVLLPVRDGLQIARKISN